MWNWADDNGTGTATPRELLGFAFPNDEQIDLVGFRRMLVEIRRVFGVEFYTVAGRPYYSIPSWEEHQKFDRRSKGKHPGPEQAETYLYLQEHPGSSDTRGKPTSTRRDSVAGTGEQGNRGTGEQGKSGTAVAAPDAPRPDALEICTHLADLIEANGSKRPEITKRWLDEARRLIDIDGRRPDQVVKAIDWCQQDPFWKGNVLSMPKLREKYDQLRLAAERELSTSKPRDRQGDLLRSEMARLDALESSSMLEIGAA